MNKNRAPGAEVREGREPDQGLEEEDTCKHRGLDVNEGSRGKGHTPGIQTCLWRRQTQVCRRGTSMREGTTGNTSGCRSLGICLLMERSQGGRKVSPAVVTSLSPKGGRQRGNLHPLHFPCPPTPEQSEQERLSGGGLSSNDTFSIPEPTLGQPPSSPRAGSPITRQTRLGANV